MTNPHRRHRLTARVAVALAVFGLVLARDVAMAQVVVQPPFTVGSVMDSGWRVLFTDAGSDPNGNLFFLWTEVQVFGGGTHPPRALVNRPATLSTLGPLVREDIDGYLGNPVVSARPFEGFATTWFEEGTPKAKGLRVMGRFWQSSGAPLGASFDVDPDTDFDGIAHIGVAGLETGAAFAWWGPRGPNTVRARIFNAEGRPRTSTFDVSASGPFPTIDMTGLPQGGFAIGFGTSIGNTPLQRSAVRVFDENGIPLGELFAVSSESVFRRIAVNAAGDTLAIFGTRSNPTGSTAINEIWVQRTTLAGVPLESEILVATGVADSVLDGDLEFDGNGNLQVVWSDLAHIENGVSALGFDAAGAAIGPPVQIATGYSPYVRTVRLPDGNFLNSLGHYAVTTVEANVTSLCTPGSAVCGDGVTDPLCEQCDAGAGNSDTTPDACRGDCRAARCGDGVVDTSEECDDGNRLSCDGCSRTCTVEAGLGCGDGIPFPTCGEPCDDGNTDSGDGCTSACALERVPGGGSPRHDCYTEWSVSNPHNTPFLDKRGDISAAQTCVDNDPTCDFDGGVVGHCTLHVEVCVNNTNIASCEPGSRVLGWKLQSPSASQAAHDPVAAAVRNAFLSVVPGSVVGPDTRNLCSPTVAVPIALKATGHGFNPRKVTIKTEATLYDDASDGDKLRLVCRPAP